MIGEMILGRPLFDEAQEFPAPDRCRLSGIAALRQNRRLRMELLGYGNDT